ncbi:threonine-phosphate decarboxylase [Gordonia sp. HNM0687]|uniref:Aminotransferase n=1 Tax=Gordonia mangrovi TaxID=2665643 RepID=A0A6L7GN99_9ACTN|nr:Rv2231c family pyridoxal phosphate-dependent protein CobC [Gordonia mangrovi]MXP21043.1 threonine-phosphate decarboxylase [Gordonia mangrovi]UVF78413.1 Rv2231c family pyridoxal phosphate-dependent protein CobC [Gordonia mangrovi]
MTSGLFARDRHGDADAEPGLVDFAVNVRGGPPPFVADALAGRIGDLATYPSADDERRAVDTIAAAHGRAYDEVLLLSGAAEGFELLPRLEPRHAALIQPSFTEPEIALRAAGVPITDVILSDPWELDSAAVPEDADLVVLGNPTNPTSVLHPASAIERLRRPGRLVVVDEAFADITLDPRTGHPEPESVAHRSRPDLIVIRSVTKTFGLAGLRAGYLLATPEVIGRVTVGRRPWPLGTLALTALTECVGPTGRDHAHREAGRIAEDRAEMVAMLSAAGIEVCGEPRASFVLIRLPQALRLKQRLREKGFAVRSAANFVGLDDDHVRLAVRDVDRTRTLVDTITAIREEIAGCPQPSQR